MWLGYVREHVRREDSRPYSGNMTRPDAAMQDLLHAWDSRESVLMGLELGPGENHRGAWSFGYKCAGSNMTYSCVHLGGGASDKIARPP